MSEFNEFKPRLESPKNRFQLSTGLNLKKVEYNFKWNQPYLSRGLNLNRSSNSLNSASCLVNPKIHMKKIHQIFVNNSLKQWSLSFLRTRWQKLFRSFRTFLTDTKILIFNTHDDFKINTYIFVRKENQMWVSLIMFQVHCV